MRRFTRSLGKSRSRNILATLTVASDQILKKKSDFAFLKSCVILDSFRNLRVLVPRRRRRTRRTSTVAWVSPKVKSILPRALLYRPPSSFPPSEQQPSGTARRSSRLSTPTTSSSLTTESGSRPGGGSASAATSPPTSGSTSPTDPSSAVGGSSTGPEGTTMPWSTTRRRSTPWRSSWAP